MEVYVITRNGVPDPKVYVALTAACEAAGVKYKTAFYTGKRTWIMPDGVVINISPAEVIKMKARGVPVTPRY